MESGSIEAVMEQMDAVLDTFDGIARHAHSVYRSYKPEHLIEHSRRSQASCMYDHMAEEATRRFQDSKDVHQIEIGGLRLWLFGDHTVARFKKMDEDGKTRNYPTKQAKSYDYGLQLEGLPPVPTRISVGYVLDPVGHLDRVQVARPNGRKVDWCAVIIPQSTRAVGAKKWEEVAKQIRAVA